MVHVQILHIGLRTKHSSNWTVTEPIVSQCCCASLRVYRTETPCRSIRDIASITLHEQHTTMKCKFNAHNSHQLNRFNKVTRRRAQYVTVKTLNKTALPNNIPRQRHAIKAASYKDHWLNPEPYIRIYGSDWTYRQWLAVSQLQIVTLKSSLKLAEH